MLELATTTAAAAALECRRRFAGLERGGEEEKVGGRRREPPSEAQHVEGVDGHDRSLLLRLREHLVVPGGQALLPRVALVRRVAPQDEVVATHRRTRPDVHPIEPTPPDMLHVADQDLG